MTPRRRVCSPGRVHAHTTLAAGRPGNAIGLVRTCRREPTSSAVPPAALTGPSDNGGRARAHQHPGGRTGRRMLCRLHHTGVGVGEHEVSRGARRSQAANPRATTLIYHSPRRTALLA
eukprot:scaffold35211_cov112-Isochrysis_galbana.AAC.3